MSGYINAPVKLWPTGHLHSRKRHLGVTSSDKRMLRQDRCVRDWDKVPESHHLLRLKITRELLAAILTSHLPISGQYQLVVIIVLPRFFEAAESD